MSFSFQHVIDQYLKLWIVAATRLKKEKEKEAEAEKKRRKDHW